MIMYTQNKTPMNTTIKEQSGKNTIPITWCYDVNGNVYIEANCKLYILEINNQNNVEFDLIENDIFKDLSPEYNIKYKKIIDTEHSLKKKVLEEIEKSDSDQDEEYQNRRIKSLCYEEDKYFEYEENESETGSNVDENDDVRYKFFQKGNISSMKLLKKGLETPSVYDTFVRDDIKNVVFSLQSDCNNYYRVSIQNSNIELNIIGDEIRHYQLSYTYTVNSEYISPLNVNSEYSSSYTASELSIHTNFVGRVAKLKQ